jgi:hypothetical protein
MEALTTHLSGLAVRGVGSIYVLSVLFVVCLSVCGHGSRRGRRLRGDDLGLFGDSRRGPWPRLGLTNLDVSECVNVTLKGEVSSKKPSMLFFITGIKFTRGSVVRVSHLPGVLRTLPNNDPAGGLLKRCKGERIGSHLWRLQQVVSASVRSTKSRYRRGQNTLPSSLRT